MKLLIRIINNNTFLFASFVIKIDIGVLVSDRFIPKVDFYRLSPDSSHGDNPLLRV
jgi:hypothetical protein